MTGWIAAFLLFGAAFGFATFAHRHHFSEGTSRRSGDPLDGRWMWVCLCTCLWPLYAVAGAYGWWRRWRRASRTPGS
jgi:hypothetical protein